MSNYPISIDSVILDLGIGVFSFLDATLWPCKLRLRLLGTVTASRLLPTVDTQGISATPNNLVSNPWKIANPTASNQNDRVFLQIVAFARNVNRNFLGIAQSDPSDLSESRVWLLRSHGTDQQANALFLGAALEHWALGGFSLYDSVTSN